MSVPPTTSRKDGVGRLMMLDKPLSPSTRCEELMHPRATVRKNGTQWIVTVWSEPYVISDADGSVKNFDSRADALAWADLQVQAHRITAGYFSYRPEVDRARAA